MEGTQGFWSKKAWTRFPALLLTWDSEPVSEHLQAACPRPVCKKGDADDVCHPEVAMGTDRGNCPLVSVQTRPPPWAWPSAPGGASSGFSFAASARPRPPVPSVWVPLPTSVGAQELGVPLPTSVGAQELGVPLSTSVGAQELGQMGILQCRQTV